MLIPSLSQLFLNSPFSSSNSLQTSWHPDHPSSVAFSPLHIPDEEALDLAAGLTPPSSPIPSVLGLTASDDPPPMTYVYLIRNARRVYLVSMTVFHLWQGFK